MTKEDLNLLANKWTHSFEEDSAEGTVYRPADYDFPRSRGRRQLDFKENGDAEALALGRGDAPEVHKGSWDAQGDQLVIHFEDGQDQVYQVHTLSKDKLVFKK